jgi:hypothetical protein
VETNPGIQSVEHVYFFAVNMADEVTLRGYLERAYFLGEELEGRTGTSERRLQHERL